MVSKNSDLKYVISIVVALLTVQTTWAQLTIDTTQTAEQLLKRWLLADDSELIIKNVSFRGSKQSIAYFKNDSSEELIDEGIILSTGNVFDSRGPNQSAKTGKMVSGLRDNDLQAIATGVVTDAVVLEFDLIALRDSIVFEYIFASEEYPEFVDKGVNDVFGFFIKEVGGRAIFPLNIARVPLTNKVVSIDNVNHRENEEYFLRSDFLTAHDDVFWSQHKRMMMRAQIFEFDGFTVPLKAVAKLTHGKTYHLKIAIADVGDRIYDSAVLLKAHSFSSKGERISGANAIIKKEIEESTSLSASIEKELFFSLIVNFNTDESVVLEKSFEPLNELADLLLRLNSLNVAIIGHTDNVGTALENQILSENRAKAVKQYLLEKGINSKKLTAVGKGESHR